MEATDRPTSAAREVMLARAQVGEDWRPLLLFVIDDFAAMRLNTFKPIGADWPPPVGSMLIERTATSMLNAGALLSLSSPADYSTS